MLFNRMTFIGIDPTAGKRPMTYVALDDELKLLALGEGSLDDVVAFTAGQQAAFVAVCSPRRPNSGVMADEKIRQDLVPQPTPGRWMNFRMCEYLLRQHDIHIPQTPVRWSEAPNWMQQGFRLFRRLSELGYMEYPNTVERQSLEVYPHASFTALLEQFPFHKSTLEGRLQRQLLLFDAGVNVPDPMKFFEEITRMRILKGILPEDQLLTTMELDALCGAYTAWLAARRPENTLIVGDPEEGTIVLPVSTLKSRYR